MLRRNGLVLGLKLWGFAGGGGDLGVRQGHGQDMEGGHQGLQGKAGQDHEGVGERAPPK